MGQSVLRPRPPEKLAPSGRCHYRDIVWSGTRVRHSWTFCKDVLVTRTIDDDCGSLIPADSVELPEDGHARDSASCLHSGFSGLLGLSSVSAAIAAVAKNCFDSSHSEGSSVGSSRSLRRSTRSTPMRSVRETGASTLGKPSNQRPIQRQKRRLTSTTQSPRRGCGSTDRHPTPPSGQPRAAPPRRTFPH